MQKVIIKGFLFLPSPPPQVKAWDPKLLDQNSAEFKSLSSRLKRGIEGYFNRRVEGSQMVNVLKFQ